jgi:rhomboid protease GluP
MEPQEVTDILFRPSREECNELALVLAAQAIPSAVRWNGSVWVLSVPAEAMNLARLELAAYTTEARSRASPQTSIAARGRPWPGIAIYTAALVLMALMAPAFWFGVDWLSAGRMDGGRMLTGEWWRPVTALMLHADAAHLLGNLLFGAFFAFSVSRYLGGGFSWLVIVLSGTLGNVANGFLAGPDHRSIGASTAVFAALGILSAYLWRRGFPSNVSRRERLTPVIAGIGLLAFTGTGGVNTDIGAHLLGFLAGFGAGLAIARTGVPKSRAAQGVSAMLVSAFLVFSWAAALTLQT